MMKGQTLLTKEKNNLINQVMKNNSKKMAVENEKPVKKKDNKLLSDHSPAVANNVTDAVKNTASVTEGLNQAKKNKNGLEPGTR